MYASFLQESKAATKDVFFQCVEVVAFREKPTETGVVTS